MNQISYPSQIDYSEYSRDNKNPRNFYGLPKEVIPAVIEFGNIVGCQFHPEKSGKIGLNIIKNFVFQ